MIRSSVALVLGLAGIAGAGVTGWYVVGNGPCCGLVCPSRATPDVEVSQEPVVIAPQVALELAPQRLEVEEPQARLAEMLCAHSFADRVFLCNSGAEANEAAIKLARRWGHANGGKRFEVVTALGSFHGRTLATLTATGQEKVRVGFHPLPEGFRYVPYDDLAAVERALTDTTAAILLEPILG